MIVRHVDSETTHADREALAQWLKVSEMTIRRHCADLRRGRHILTGRALYDAEAVAARLVELGVTGRPHRRLSRMSGNS